MNIDIKREIRLNARLAYGLLNVLKDDIDTLRININKNNDDKLEESMRDTKDTLQKIVDTVVDLEYALYLDTLSETRKRQSPL